MQLMKKSEHFTYALNQFFGIRNYEKKIKKNKATKKYFLSYATKNVSVKRKIGDRVWHCAGKINGRKLGLRIR